jgi:hypothetical protein
MSGGGVTAKFLSFRSWGVRFRAFQVMVPDAGVCADCESAIPTCRKLKSGTVSLTWRRREKYVISICCIPLKFWENDWSWS